MTVSCKISIQKYTAQQQCERDDGDLFFNMLYKDKSKKHTMAYIHKVVSYGWHYSENENASKVVGTRNGSRLAFSFFFFLPGPSFVFFPECNTIEEGHNIHVYGWQQKREREGDCEIQRERERERERHCLRRQEKGRKQNTVNLNQQQTQPGLIALDRH